MAQDNQTNTDTDGQNTQNREYIARAQQRELTHASVDRRGETFTNRESRSDGSIAPRDSEGVSQHSGRAQPSDSAFNDEAFYEIPPNDPFLTRRPSGSYPDNAFETDKHGVHVYQNMVDASQGNAFIRLDNNRNGRLDGNELAVQINGSGSDILTINGRKLEVNLTPQQESSLLTAVAAFRDLDGAAQETAAAELGQLVRQTATDATRSSGRDEPNNGR